MLLLTESGERLPGLIERAFRLAEIGVGHGDVRFGIARRALQLGQCDPAFLEGVFPLRSLRRQRRAVTLDPRDFLQARGALLPRGGGVGVGAAGPFGRGCEPGFDLRGFDLPAHALFASRLLLRFEIGECAALGTELFRGAHPLQLSLLQLRVHAAEPCFDFRQAPRQAVDLGRDFLRLAARVNQAAIRLPLFGATLQLGAARLLRRLRRGREGSLRCRELLDGRLFGRPGAIEIGRGIVRVLFKGGKLRAAL